MIAFLVLCYVGVLAILVKLKVITLTLGWKLSPILFTLVCLILLILPLQWGAPSGPANVYQGVVEIIPNVSGQVLEIHAQPLVPMKQGDVLFTIDPELYQADVDRLSAALREAEQAAEMLPADLAAANATVTQSESAVVNAKQQAQTLAIAVTGAKATVAKTEAQLKLAEGKFERASTLRETDAVSAQQLETEQRNFESAKASLAEATAGLDQAQAAFDSQVGGVNTIVLQAEAALAVAQAMQSKARLAVESTINGENTSVAQLRAQLATAQLNLDYTQVRAPSDGYVVGLSLRPGQRVANFPVRGWMTFVEDSGNRIAVAINQNAFRHLEPGQPAEIIFKLFPGQTFAAKVESLIYITAEGQLQASGLVPNAPGAQINRPYGAILAIDTDEDTANSSAIDLTQLPGGATGVAAIYTSSMKPTHLIRRVELRMKSWLNYILP